MNSHWFAFAMLVAALAIGYSVFVDRDSPLPDDAAQAIIQGQFVRNAIYTETDAAGRPRARFAASEVQQDESSDKVIMAAVRADYIWPAKTGAHGDHWVLNADQATLDARKQLELRGNVKVHNVPELEGARMLTLHTAALDVDTEKQTAHTAEPFELYVDGHMVQARGLNADLRRQHYRLQSEVVLRMAAADQPEPMQPQDKKPLLSLPEYIKSDEAVYEGGVFVFKNVRSTSEPFIEAREARTSSADTANNQIVLRGAVRVELPKRGQINADVATLILRNGRIARVELTGDPVTFQHRSQDSDRLINGHADRVEYELPEQNLRLSGDALFNNGSFEIVFETIQYNLITESARGTNSRGRSLPQPATGSTQTPPP